MGRSHLTPKRFLEILNRIADRQIGKMEREFLAAVEVSAASVNPEALRRAITSRDVAAVFRIVNLNGQLEPRLRRTLERNLQTVFARAAIAAEATLPVDMGMSFDLVNPRAVKWARNQTAQLVTQISASARANIRKFIARNIREGIGIKKITPDIARTLRRDLKATLGLTEKSYDGLRAVRAKLQQRAEASRLLREGIDRAEIASQLNVTPQYVGRLANRRWLWIDHAVVEQRVDREAARRLKQRATTIARTETLTAANAGNHEVWQQAAEQGLIDVEQTRRIFVVAKDDRLCPQCRAVPGMNPQGVALNEPFKTPLGPKLNPPIHVNCRCSTGIRTQVVTKPLPIAA